MRKGIVFFFLFVCFFSHGALAVDPPVQQGNHQTQMASKKTDDTYAPFRPVSEWSGERFVFLSQSKGITAPRFYDHFQVGQELHAYPEYDQYVGKTAKVVAVEECHDHWEVEFEMEHSKERIFASARAGGIEGIAWVHDIKSARDRWLGETVVFKGNTMMTWERRDGKMHTVPMPIKKYTQVKVVEVVAGSENNTPVRFVLETTDGEKGYVDIAWSGTNSYEFARSGLKTFDTIFAVIGSS